MAVLVNRHSASASELVSACWQDHKRVTVIGDRTFGKGTVVTYSLFEPTGGILNLTTATFWRPSGKNLEKIMTNGKEDEDWGVVPMKASASRSAAMRRPTSTSTCANKRSSHAAISWKKKRRRSSATCNWSARLSTCASRRSNPMKRSFDRFLAILGCAIVVALALVFFPLDGAFAQPPGGKEIYQDFRGGKPLADEWKLIGSEADKAGVTFEEKGLHVIIPRTRNTTQPVGIRLMFPLRRFRDHRDLRDREPGTSARIGPSASRSIFPWVRAIKKQFRQASAGFVGR